MQSLPPKLLKFLLNGAYRAQAGGQVSWCLLPYQVPWMPDPYIRPRLTRFLIPNIHNGTEMMPTNERGHHMLKTTYKPF